MSALEFVMWTAVALPVVTAAFIWLGGVRWLMDRFATPEQLRIAELMDGALVMGPEGWERMGDRQWKLRAGNIQAGRRKFAAYEDFYGFYVAGAEVPLRLCDQRHLTRTIDKWEEHHRKQAKARKMRDTVDRLDKHVERHQSQFDELDGEVVRKRMHLPAPRRYDRTDHY